jgi:hypothetical protein
MLREATDQRMDRVTGSKWMQQHQVDVRIGRHLAAPEAAMSHERRALGQTLADGLGKLVQGGLKQAQDNSFQKIGEVGADLHAGRAAVVLPPELVATGGKFVAGGDDGWTKVRAAGHAALVEGTL